MPRVVFTRNLAALVPCPPTEMNASTVKEALEKVFQINEPLKNFVLDEEGKLQKHMVVFVDNELIRDRQGLSDSLNDNSEVYVMQALSGG